MDPEMEYVILPDSARQFSSYRDAHYRGTTEEQDERLLTSKTVYVGNLSYYSTESQIYEVFSKCGNVKKIIIGLDRYQNTPCGFCFVEYFYRSDAEDCVRYIDGTKIDERTICVDWDSGFVEGRQYGRGRKGGQVRDEQRIDSVVGREVHSYSILPDNLNNL